MKLCVLLCILLTAVKITESKITLSHKKPKRGNITKPAKFVFVHGLLQSEHDAITYASKTFNILPGDYLSFTLPCSEGMPWRTCNPTKLSFAQKFEVEKLDTICSAIKGPFVLAGLSMGASTILNYAGTHKNHNLKALVVESPFDKVTRVIHKNISEKFDPITAKAMKLVTFSHFDPQGLHPQDTAPHIRKDMPILLVHSKFDLLIPLEASLNLYRLLKNSGHKNAHLLILNRGTHAFYHRGINATEARRYLVTVHAFYKKYNLPHNPEWAAEGEPIFATCQPDL